MDTHTELEKYIVQIHIHTHTHRRHERPGAVRQQPPLKLLRRLQALICNLPAITII